MSVANHRCAFRPVRSGTLIFQPHNNEAGTLGAVLTSDGQDRWLLTCRHVVARPDNRIVITDSILQPDIANGAIATLAGALADQALDCAAARLQVSSSDEVLGLGKPTAFKAPTVGMRVVKSGWKTGVTEGQIRQLSGNEVVIERLAGYPSDYLLGTRGDSGSVWLETMTLAPVALHTREAAVGPHLAFASAFPAVLSALNLRQI
jgi:hypothetical protein